jgi:hypothetical protein
MQNNGIDHFEISITLWYIHLFLPTFRALSQKHSSRDAPNQTLPSNQMLI